MKRVICLVMCLILMLTAVLVFTACGNMGVFDVNFVLNYVVVNENGTAVLHRVEKWYDTESDSACFRLSCCNNYIWTSSNVAVAYTNKPASYAYDKECKGN